MTWRGYVLVLAFLSVVAFGFWYVVRVTAPPSPLPTDVLAIVEDSDRVRVQRMLPMIGQKPRQGSAFFENCNMVGSGKAHDPDDRWIRNMREILTDGSTYVPGSKAGTPVPQVVVRFARGEHRVDVMLDFNLDTSVVQLDGITRGTALITPRRSELLALIKPLFPEDREIQAVPDPK